MGEIKNDSESIVRGIREVYDKLWEQREKLGSLMMAVGKLSDKAEKFEAENIRLNKDIQDKEKQHAEELRRAAK